MRAVRHPRSLAVALLPRQRPSPWATIAVWKRCGRRWRTPSGRRWPATARRITPASCSAPTASAGIAEVTRCGSCTPTCALRRWPPRLALADDAPAGDGRRRRPLGLPRGPLGPAPAHGPLSGDHDVRHRGAGPGRMRDGARRPLAGDRHRRRWPPVPANDPHLLEWVHIAEADSFLTAHQRYGARRLGATGCDGYVAGLGRVASGLGVVDPAHCRRAAPAHRRAFVLSCTGRRARDAAQYLLLQPPLPLAARPAYTVLAAAVAVAVVGEARAALAVATGDGDGRRAPGWPSPRPPASLGTCAGLADADDGAAMNDNDELDLAAAPGGGGTPAAGASRTEGRRGGLGARRSAPRAGALEGKPRRTSSSRSTPTASPPTSTSPAFTATSTTGHGWPGHRSTTSKARAVHPPGPAGPRPPGAHPAEAQRGVRRAS